MKLQTNRTCTACDKPLAFVPSAVSRQMMVLDPEPVADGTIVIREGKALVLKKEDLFASEANKAREGEPRYKSHYATCTDPERFRRTGSR